MTHLVTDLNEVERLAAQHHDDFQVMRYLLEFRDDIPDAQIDAMIDTIAAPIVEAIDCTQCANCCRHLDVYLTPGDANRLATGLTVSVDEIAEHYIEREETQQVGEWGKFSTSPCVFLRGKLCSVYTHRPETCRTYPAFTPDFRWLLQDIVEGAALCPIIYNVLVAVTQQVDAL